MTQVKQNMLPRWRGFNLLEMISANSKGDWQENDFKWIADWGFDFVRLPLCYNLWTDPKDPFALREEWLEKLDCAVALGEKYGIHVCLNLHKAPGYSVQRTPEDPFILWLDERAQEAFYFQWSVLARRYRGIPSTKLSFNLLNEPPAPKDTVDWDTHMTLAEHEKIMRATRDAIKNIDPQRLIIADGTTWGLDVRPEIADLGISLDCRGYFPMSVAFRDAFDSKFCKFWLGMESWPTPQWPGGVQKGESWDRKKLDDYYDAWTEVAVQKGVGLICGECGAFNKTPHAVFLAWFRDVLESLTERNIGFALWNFRGPFGILDSQRSDVAYADWHGHALDAELLKLLQNF